MLFLIDYEIDAEYNASDCVQTIINYKFKMRIF